MHLKLHEIKINDELFNPLSSEENSFNLLNLDSFDQFVTETQTDKKDAFEFTMKLILSGNKSVEGRTRYNFWDLLGDLGGFHGSLHIITSVFMSLYASLAFQANYLSEKIIDDINENHSLAF